MGQYASGYGPGAVTDDGCPVEIYLRIRTYGEAGYVQSEVRAGSRILDLGAGVGRITHPLIEAGFVVTAVDQSAEMLAHTRNAEIVQSSIEALDLSPRKFEGVLLASYLLNTPDPAVRAALLRTCRKHLNPGGVLIAQIRPVSILSVQTGRGDEENGIRFAIDRYKRDGRFVTISSSAEMDGRRWVQTFTHEYLDQANLARELEAEGFGQPRWLTADAQWSAATAV